jgi:superfamily II DNA or RNA helicase
MMNFTQLNIKTDYRSSNDDVVKSFYNPVLSNSILYKRAVGFFSSSSLIELSLGIEGLIKNNGRIQLISSPRLDEKDLEAISKGYLDRNKAIENSLLRSLYAPHNEFEEERLNFISNLICQGYLDIKIAFLETKNKLGMYHEKIGIMYDKNENKLAFNGSLNETQNAFSSNFESIDVFFSWVNGDDKRVETKEKDFDELWDDNTSGVKVIKFPKAVEEKMLSYKKDDLVFENKENYIVKKKIDSYPAVPEGMTLYDYQLEAINNWRSNNFKGIFNMATGTGKTITGLSAIVELSKYVHHDLFIIIVCPYQHLVEQWVEDIIKFNVNPIIGYSSSAQKDWKRRLKREVTEFDMNLNIQFKKSCLFITTNATYSSSYVQEQINRLSGNVLIVVDEAHNFGALNMRNYQLDNVPYRLALSATIDRHGDPEGTKSLREYFGSECINYSLEVAIREGKLTPYYYYPIATYLSASELQQYRELSKELAKCYMFNEDGIQKLSEKGKKIAIKRARHVAGAVDKLGKLKEEILKNPKQFDKHTLVYCGATTINDPDYLDGVINLEETKQITHVLDILGNELNLKVAKFTSEENREERIKLKQEFSKGNNIQALVAIKCLDEGVNIPEIKNAFILASSTNPKEYIQRRGRVLRLAEGKEYSIIYDFVTLPRDLKTIKNFNEHEIAADLSLVKKEIERIKDFSSLAINETEGLKLIDKLKEAYSIKEV